MELRFGNLITLLDGVLFSTYFILLYLAIFWILVLFSNEKKKLQKMPGELPIVSVIIPAYNEEKSLLETVRSVQDLDYPHLEILIVDDGSKDGTNRIAREIVAKDERVRLLAQKNKGKGAALNYGISKANGKFFACLDADSSVDKDALKIMLPYFAESDVAAVCPLLKVKNPKRMIERLQWFEYVINMFYKYLNAKIDCVHVTPGPFSLYRTEAIKKIGCFDEHNITEDMEIAIRLQKYHYRIVQTFDTVVRTIAPHNWKGLFKQRIRWYTGALDNTIGYKKMMFKKEFGDFAFIRMPTIILGGAITLILLTTIIVELFKSAVDWFYVIKSINFDIVTLLMNFKLNYNVLLIPVFKLFIAATLMGISFFVMIYAYRVINERISRYGKTWLSLCSYLFLYGLFISGVWVYIAYSKLAKKKVSW